MPAGMVLPRPVHWVLLAVQRCAHGTDADARPADPCPADARPDACPHATDTRPVEIHQPWLVLPYWLAARQGVQAVRVHPRREEFIQVHRLRLEKRTPLFCGRSRRLHALPDARACSADAPTNAAAAEVPAGGHVCWVLWLRV
jgi:hypothetical protein